MLSIRADDWFMQSHFKYTEKLLTSITRSAMPRKSEEANFFSDLHLFYSCRILHNAKINDDRNLAISSIQKNVIWDELLTKHENLDATVSPISEDSVSRRARYFRYINRFLYRAYNKLTRSKMGSFVFRLPLKLVSTSRLRQKLQPLIQAKLYYKAEVNGYVFGKTEIVALVELMLLLNEVMVAKTVLDHTRLLFSVPPDSLWFEHTLFRCNFIVNNGDAKTIYPHEPHSIFRIAEDFIKPSDMSVVVKTYIVERDITMCFENKVGVLESELPCEEECLAINNLSLTLTRNSTLLTQGEFHSTTDFFIGPMGLNLINLGRDHLVAIKTQRFEVYDGEFAPFLLSSAGISNYWHALIDSLPRLVHLQDEQPIILMGEPSSEIVALIKLLKPRSKIFTYSHSGALLNRVVRSHLSVITKEPFWDGERPCFDVSTLLKFRSELLKSFEEMSADKSKFRADKVFLIRNSTHRRSEIENLKELLEGQGFVSIDPSVLSIPEQAKLFSTAKVVVGEVGAAWANLIFCTPGTQIFSLCAESSAPTPLFGGFAQILGLDFYSVAFPDAWIYDSENHWNNTPEAFFQSGFNLTDEHVARAANFILKSSILN